MTLLLLLLLLLFRAFNKVTVAPAAWAV